MSKAFGDRLLIDNLTFKLPRGGIVGVIGPNGAGKTTLFRMIMGVEKPDKGTIKIGETVKLGYVDQSRDALDDDKTIYDEISEGVETHHARRALDQRARRTSRASTSRARISRSGSASCRAASATASTSRR